MGAPTTHSAQIGNSVVYGVRELHDMDQVATFDAGHADAAIDPTTLKFVNDANKAIRELLALNPMEAPEFRLKTEGYSVVADQLYAIDYRTLRFLSDVECEAQVFRLDSSVNFEKSAAGVTMLLLKDKGFLTNTDYRKVPYVFEDRKRILQQITFYTQSLSILQSIYDTVFKMVNISSDIWSGAAVVTAVAAIVAVANLIQLFAQLAVLIVQLIKLIKANRELLMPPVRYHIGINLYQYLVKGCMYLNMNFETNEDLKNKLSRIALLGSKSDEVGEKTDSPLSNIDIDGATLPLPGDGLLRPSDYGYRLGQAFEYVKQKFNCKSACKDGNYHIRPKNDPFWTQTPAHVIPSVNVEEALNYQNGYTEYNYSDVRSRYLIEYAKDDSDLHTITDVNNRMSELIYDHPVSERRRSLFIGDNSVTDVQLPYALCVRKLQYSGIYSGVFADILNLVNTFNSEIGQTQSGQPVLLQVLPPSFPGFNLDEWIQEGALLVENHYFSTPKIVYLDPDINRIPANFADEIGADALWINYHSWESMAPGWKNLDNPNESNQKLIFRNVKIPFGILNWQQTIVNSQCTVSGYGDGEFISIKWNTGHDFAVCDFFIYQNWAPNMTADLYKIAPVKEKINITLLG